MNYYVFLMRRPHDKQAWPVVWEHRDLAINEPYRVSKVVELYLRQENASLAKALISSSEVGIEPVFP